MAELAGQVARLQESVTTLSGLLFGSSSEKRGPASRGNGRGDDGSAGDGGTRPGGPGHGRRDRSQLETEERVIDVGAGQRCCAECGKPFEFLGTEDSEQAGWRVKITRIVWRRRRYRRRCACRGRHCMGSAMACSTRIRCGDGWWRARSQAAATSAVAYLPGFSGGAVAWPGRSMAPA